MFFWGFTYFSLSCIMPLIHIKRRSRPGRPRPRPPLLFQPPRELSPSFGTESDAELITDDFPSEDSPTPTALAHVQKWKTSRLGSSDAMKPTDNLINDLVNKITSGTTASSSSNTQVQLARKETNLGLKKAVRPNTKAQVKSQVCSI